MVPAVAPRVLVIGLDPYRVPGPWDPAPVAAAIAASMTALSARGFDAESCLVGLDGSEDVHAVAVAALQSRPQDCVVIGGGIRGAEDLLDLFEAMVNLVRRFDCLGSKDKQLIAFVGDHGTTADAAAG